MLKFQFILDEIKDQYLLDQRPWIIGFSGGKDSSLLLQLVWYALRQLPKAQLTKTIHVICNDTLVENPKIVEWIDKSLERIQNQAQKEALPFVVVKTTPMLEDTFWVNLIGKGYPSPNSMFRWCTERLKIKPTSRYIQSQIEKNGEVIILLGTRSDESATRKRSMEKFQIDNQRLKRHMDLPLAYVYTPIKSLTVNELWQYLLQVPSPWNGSNRELITLYKNGSGGDCPLVIDTTTPSCGQSRFGCWVCTVVNKDRSMEAMIDNGEEWMLPLLELRDWLVENRDLDEHRMHRRRNGLPGKGPFNIEARKLVLKKLLEAQKEIAQSLITNQEMKAIQVLWNMDGFNQNVYDIYNDVYETKFDEDMTTKDILKKQQTDSLKAFSEKHRADFEKLQNILKAVVDKGLLSKRISITKTIENLFEQSQT